MFSSVWLCLDNACTYMSAAGFISLCIVVENLALS